MLAAAFSFFLDAIAFALALAFPFPLNAVTGVLFAAFSFFLDAIAFALALGFPLPLNAIAAVLAPAIRAFSFVLMLLFSDFRMSGPAVELLADRRQFDSALLSGLEIDRSRRAELFSIG